MTVSIYLAKILPIRSFRSLSGYTGISPSSFFYQQFSSDLLQRGGYVLGNASAYNGNDLIREAGGGVVAVLIQYRLGLFGFLPGQKVKQGGALNAGLRKYLSSRREEKTLIFMIQLISRQHYSGYRSMSVRFDGLTFFIRVNFFPLYLFRSASSVETQRRLLSGESRLVLVQFYSKLSQMVEIQGRHFSEPQLRARPSFHPSTTITIQFQRCVGVI